MLESAGQASGKLGRNVASKELNSISRSRVQINSNPKLPYIAVLLDLGSNESQVSATYPTRKPSGDATCLRIHARGLSRKTYGFLPISIVQVMNKLALRDIVFPHTLPIVEDLKVLLRTAVRTMKEPACSCPVDGVLLGRN